MNIILPVNQKYTIGAKLRCKKLSNEYLCRFCENKSDIEQMSQIKKKKNGLTIWEEQTHCQFQLIYRGMFGLGDILRSDDTSF